MYNSIVSQKIPKYNLFKTNFLKLRQQLILMRTVQLYDEIVIIKKKQI